MEVVKQVTIEESVGYGTTGRWRIIDCSDGITAAIETFKVHSGRSYTSYRLCVSGELRPDKVIIANREHPNNEGWRIFQIEKDGTLYDVHPSSAIGRWIWAEKPDDIRCSTAGNKLFILHLSGWGVANAIEHDWSPEEYWLQLRRAAGVIRLPWIDIDDPCFSINDYLADLQPLIQQRQRLSELESCQAKIGEVVKSVMGLYPQEDGSEVATLAKSLDSLVASPGNKICRTMHEIARLTGTELPEGEYLQPYKRPADRRK